MDLINIASGYLPLSLDDVDRGTFTQVVNYDPLDDSVLTGTYGALISHQTTALARSTLLQRFKVYQKRMW